ncbi:hypothetical protein WR25_15741 [Diploscapter pachys]|uniref:Kelch repeat protein n=1 Tax=Diploscapter pachys TaxID=2018661 RepID=A0A2A2KYP0_9BILA|nr:hypothetical protein WR25_15741 [Diploscapter pachys]
MLWSIHLDGGPRRVNHAAVALNGAIYSFGGYCSNEQSDGTEPIDIHMLNTSNYRWKRVYHTNVTENENSIDDTVDLDGGDGRNKELNKQLPYMRYGHTVVEYRGKAYLWGGRNDEYGASSQLHEFDPNTRLWRLVPVQNRFPPARDGHSAVVWGHKMYIFGGFEEEAQRFSQETYVYDFPTARWSLFNTTGPLPLWRDFHTAVQIDGTMYVFGGRSDITGEASSH